MTSGELAEEFERQLSTMTKAQYLILVMAIEAAGGEISIDARAIAERSLKPAPKMLVHGYDGKVTLSMAQVGELRQVEVEMPGLN